MAQSLVDLYKEAIKKLEGQDGEEKPQPPSGEPRVKQVTFLDADLEDKGKGPKKEPRKRTKKIVQQLRNQMEFYFGDSNLSKDRFMKEFTEKDPEGYVPVSVFMGFNNILKLTSDADLLVKAVKMSDFLQVNEDGTKVRRTTPVNYLTQEETDARTVYVEGFHKFISHDWVKSKFSKCGKVTYISMPRFKTSKEIKGYAFVEFEKPEEALKAVKMLNSVPDELGKNPEEKVSGSIKQSKNLSYWMKRASKEGIDPAELEASLKDLAKEREEEGPKEGMKTKSKKKKKKNRSSVSQGEDTGISSITRQKTDNTTVAIKDEAKENSMKQEASSEADDTKMKKSKKSKKKRKRKASVHKLASEDGTAQGSTESEIPRKTEAKVSEDSKDSIKTAVTKQGEETAESVGQVSRKRQRPEETATDQTSAKTPKIDPCLDKEGKKESEERGGDDSTRYVCTSLEGSHKVWELCEAGVSGKDSASQKDSGRKRKKQTDEETEDCDQQSRQSHTEKVKDKTVVEDLSTATQKSDGQKSASKKRKGDPADTSQEKMPKGKKQKDGKFGGQSRRSVDQTPEVTPGEGRKRKRKSLEGGDEASSRKRKRSNAGSSSEVMSEAEDQEGKKKRRRKHRPAEPDIRLRVMRKETWMQLKKDYLEQQKVNMRKLKEQLREASQKRRREQSKNKQNNGQGEAVAETKGSRPAPEFVPNVILEVKSEAELCLQTIKADIPPSVQVAYVDIRPGMTEGYIRCKDAESAGKLLKTGLRGLSLSQVEGDAEVQYWNKLTSDREAKLSDSKRRKRRGKLKILQRAQNPHEESSQPQHLIFAEDNLDRSTNPVAMRDDFNAYSCRRHPTPRVS